FYEEFGWALRWTDFDRPADEQSVKPFVYTYISDIEREKELAESKRLFYVANTRARDHLLLSGFVQNKDGLDGFMNSLDLSRDNWLHWTLYVLGQNNWDNQSGTVKLENGAKVDVNIHSHTGDSSLPSAAEILSGVERGEGANEQFGDVLSTDEIARRWKPDSAPGRIDELNPSSLKHLMESEAEIEAKPSQVVHYAEKANRSPDSGTVTGTEFGSLAHKLFEKFLNGASRDDHELIDGVIKNLKKEQIKLVRDELSAILQKFKETDLYKSLSDSEYYTEIPFLASLGSVPLSGQIDLLIKSPDDKYTVVDFKSDDIAVNEIAATATNYRAQILGYVYAVAQSTGSLPEKAVLYFMRLGRSEEITVTQKDLDELEERVSRARIANSEMS
ncbi:MAG: hypothetical protein GF372_00700, partial [Candidatus Marinimicrobia bacterium]|nr:hypothetical protein [Candidatus Neomarinimicrobiota bacterium]